jgi:tetratricopeptide (TPR) repeat protein
MTSSGSSQHGWWVEDLSDVCVEFQVDLSCLVDGELEEAAAGRAVAHLELCDTCREFFEDTKQQVLAHRELADPGRLLVHYSSLVGSDIDREVETIELVHKLATIFYQLGKAYVLADIDPDFRTRIFEEAVAVEATRSNGRGFVDGVLSSGRAGAGGVDWQGARHMLNGRLSKIEAALEKGKRLLRQALDVDSTHEEARLYLAFVDAHEGRKIRAATEFRRVFNTSVDPANRAHAAVQLGNLLADEGEFKRAVACFRWITMSGLADDDDRFFFARFNLGMYYADLRDQPRSLASFRALLDRHPTRVQEVADLFAHSPRTRAVIQSQPGFAEALFERCPELFSPAEGGPGSVGDSESE